MNRPFRFGLQAGRVNDAAGWTALARRAEADGYSCLMIPDHLGRLGPFPALMAAAAVTSSRLKLSSYVLNQDWRPPAILAQDAASVQILTSGRVELGIGAGWAIPEYRQAGIPFDSGPVRIDRFDEYLQVVKGLLWATEPFSFDGRFFRLTEHLPLPRDPRVAPPPIVVGGGSPRILATAGRLADIISISTRATPDGRVNARNIRLAEVENKLASIRAAAGARFDNIELNMTVREVRITHDRRAAARQLLAEWSSGRTLMANSASLTEDDVLDSPHEAIGTVDQICEQFETQRARWGINYFEISSTDADAIAPVVERLAGSAVV